MKLVGTVKEFRWQNPHTWIEVLVPDEKGKEVLWGVELTSPTYLIRAGWKSNTIKPGDKVTVMVNPVRSGEPAGIFRSLTLADGRVLTERPARLGHGGLQVGRHATDCSVGPDRGDGVGQLFACVTDDGACRVDHAGRGRHR